ncbi:unnamed protein product, partial [Rhizoctonia solani]
MNFANLPPEVLYLIALVLRNDSKSIASFCAINRRTYQTLHMVLYQSVNLLSTESVVSFCEVITLLQPKYSAYITSLRIGCVNIQDFRLNKSLAPHLRQVLQNLEGLKSLSLAITPKALNILLADIKAPFHLDTLVHSGRMSTPLLRFLEGQPSITKLGWHGAMNTRELNLLCCSAKGDPSLLSNLEVLEGPLYLLKALIPIRRVSSITVLQWLEYHLYIEEFLDSLQHTMVPITRLEFVENVPIGTGWLGKGWIEIVKRLRSTPALTTLKEIRVVKLFEMDMNNQEPNIEDVFPSDSPFDFLQFEALEKFEFIHNTG